MPKLAILLFVASAAYRNCPLGSMVSPAIDAPAVKGEPATGVKAPLAAIENPEMVPAAPFPTYSKPAVGETTRDCGLATVAVVPAISLKSPFCGSMLKVEIEPEPWFNTYKNVHAELTPRATGPVCPVMGTGGSAVPTGVSRPL